MPRTLSFDVGIRNLGVAIIHDTTVTYLDTIDVLQDHLHICNAICQNGKICNKKARYSHLNKWVCGVHNPNKGKKKRKTKNSKNISVQELHTSVIMALEKHPEFLDCNVVLIENQPNRASMRVKAVSYVLYAYFLIKGVLCEQSSINDVRMCSATNKLKIYKGSDVLCIMDQDYDRRIKDGEDCTYFIRGMPRNSYDERKLRSIAYCKLIMEDSSRCALSNIVFSDDIKTHFQELKKKDDAADALLQGVWFVEKIKI